MVHISLVYADVNILGGSVLTINNAEYLVFANKGDWTRSKCRE